MDEILIIGNVVSLRSVSETKKISTEEFYESLSQCVGMMTPFLPPAVVFYAARENVSVYVTHHQPQMRDVKVKYSDDNEEEFEIKLPHLYFFHKYQYSAFDDLFVFAAKEQVYSVADNLFRIPLKNLYVDGRVCLGDDLKFNLEGRMSGKIARVENYFWNSVFNSDLDSTYRNAAPGEWSCDPLSYWEELSKNEEFDPCEVNWRKHKNWKEQIDIILEREE